MLNIYLTQLTHSACKPSLLYCWGPLLAESATTRLHLTVFHEFLPIFTNFVVSVTNLSLTLRSSSNSCAYHKIGENREKFVKNCQMQPSGGRFCQKMFLNNPTSSKLVFYSIPVNITRVVRTNSDILISSSVNVNYVKKTEDWSPSWSLPLFIKPWNIA